MVRLGNKPRMAAWKVQTNPLGYVGTPFSFLAFTKMENRMLVVNETSVVSKSLISLGITTLAQ